MPAGRVNRHTFAVSLLKGVHMCYGLADKSATACKSLCLKRVNLPAPPLLGEMDAFTKQHLQACTKVCAQNNTNNNNNNNNNNSNSNNNQTNIQPGGCGHGAACANEHTICAHALCTRSVQKSARFVHQVCTSQSAHSHEPAYACIYASAQAWMRAPACTLMQQTSHRVVGKQFKNQQLCSGHAVMEKSIKWRTEKDSGQACNAERAG
eukprot:1150416-Pelagomonas_calceolata.AAC.7